jgi:hypothetical protein
LASIVLQCELDLQKYMVVPVEIKTIKSMDEASISEVKNFESCDGGFGEPIWVVNGLHLRKDGRFGSVNDCTQLFDSAIYRWQLDGNGDHMDGEADDFSTRQTTQRNGT